MSRRLGEHLLSIIAVALAFTVLVGLLRVSQKSDQ